MKGFTSALGVALLLAAFSVAAKDHKMLICHVGNETGPGGETYFDDPDCVPSDANNFFCPDAGKIDLIVVAEKAADNHLDDSSHFWDGFYDYDPIAEGASGSGTEDSDGNGIDDGCEIPDTCPCWEESELQAITWENIAFPGSCGTDYPIYLELYNITQDNLFYAESSPLIGIHYCGSYAYDLGSLVSPEEADICIAQLAKRCSDIGYPVVPD